MPVLGYRGYKGAYLPYANTETLPVGITTKLVKVQISSSYDSIVGRLCLSSRRNSYDGIKISLKLVLKVAKDGKNECNEVDMFEHAPIETMLTSSGQFSGHQKLDFLLNIPKDRIYPNPFISSTGSLSYRLVIQMSTDGKVEWKTIAKKLFLDFRAYSNLSSMDFHPSVDFKEFLDGKITSTFTLNKPVVLVGRDTILKATLQLEGTIAYQVDVSVTLLRQKQIGEIVQTEIISQQRQLDKFHEHSITLAWNLDVPLNLPVTYANELRPMYSVRYFLKYKASFKQLSNGNCDPTVFGHGDSIVEVKVGTSFVNSSDLTKITEHLEKLTLETRRTSVTSMLTLPPAYSDLSSSIGSVLSLETASQLNDMGSFSSYTNAQTLLKSAQVGDIIEFNRITYSHYAFYIGHGICVHVTSPNITFCSSSSSNAGKTGGKCAKRLIEIANGDKCRVNNHTAFTIFRNVCVRHVNDAITLATNKLPRNSNGELILGECVKEDYQLVSNKNCEGWATYWRFDVPAGFSLQALNPIINSTVGIIERISEVLIAEFERWIEVEDSIRLKLLGSAGVIALVPVVKASKIINEFFICLQGLLHNC